ncbi:uncharacterized protein CLUP02_05718 [Colletotrichum lupini]|uniref:Uncharacterized protein n=1 Tax=Colletotrichum lupini TaxID=145971 RepID=A0A9Q8SMR6_9PEZI|nr:uncharacterized protein CLUP02_05718 [Colletotrichum lupini]UQC80236.1 hypothetical protein CLUP02_05718 [Colletotrichum lupini]
MDQQHQPRIEASVWRARPLCCQWRRIKHHLSDHPLSTI